MRPARRRIFARHPLPQGTWDARARVLVAGEAVRIEIDRLVDAEGRPVVAALGLTYD